MTVTQEIWTVNTRAITRNQGPLMGLNGYRGMKDLISTTFNVGDDADWDTNLKKHFQAFGSTSQCVQCVNGTFRSP